MLSASASFKGFDTNGNDKISCSEFMSENFFRLGCSKRFSIDFCEKLDDDKDGFLEFEDFIVFWYLFKNKRLVYCDGCGAFVDAVYLR